MKSAQGTEIQTIYKPLPILDASRIDLFKRCKKKIKLENHLELDVLTRF